MTANHNGILPAGDGLGDAVKDDGFTEDGAAEDVTDGAVRTSPHLLKLELLHARLVGGDRRALDADLVLEDGLCRINRDLVVRLRMG